MQFVVQKGQSSAKGILAVRLGQLIYSSPSSQHSGCPQNNLRLRPDQLQFPQPPFDEPTGYTPPAVGTFFPVSTKEECNSLPEKRIHPELNLTRNWSTPNYLQYTNQASIPHICWNIAIQHLVHCDAPLLVPLSGCFTMTEPLIKYEKGVKAFAAIPADPLIIVCNQDPLRLRSTDVINRTSVSVWTHGGRKLINEKDFHRIVDAFKPEVVTSLIDEKLPKDCSCKQTVKYTEKAVTYLQRNAAHITNRKTNDEHNGETDTSQDMQEKTDDKPQLFASIPFSNDFHALDGAVNKILELENQICGYSLCNLIPSIDQIDFLSLEQKLNRVLERLSRDKPRLLLGSFPPEKIIRLARLGIDLFDNSYCTEMTDLHRAILLPQQLSPTSGDEGMEPSVSWDTLELSSKELYETDFNVIDSECDCYTCRQKFSRSYICHLANAQEMLAKVLLQMHNIRTYDRLFELIRNNHD